MADIGIKFDKKTEVFSIVKIDFKKSLCLEKFDSVYIPASDNENNSHFAFISRSEQIKLIKLLVANL